VRRKEVDEKALQNAIGMRRLNRGQAQDLGKNLADRYVRAAVGCEERRDQEGLLRRPAGGIQHPGFACSSRRHPFL
jgi:hypothetical protein